jgi:hypothetical protein
VTWPILTYKEVNVPRRSKAGHIRYLRILYPITITAKKDMDIYPISFVKNFASIVTVSEQQKVQTW